jgi:hypothetical protein
MNHLFGVRKTDYVRSLSQTTAAAAATTITKLPLVFQACQQVSLFKSHDVMMTYS